MDQPNVDRREVPHQPLDVPNAGIVQIVNPEQNLEFRVLLHSLRLQRRIQIGMAARIGLRIETGGEKLPAAAGGLPKCRTVAARAIS